GPAAIGNDDVGRLGQHVDNFSLALVAPLETDDAGISFEKFRKAVGHAGRIGGLETEDRREEPVEGSEKREARRWGTAPFCCVLSPPPYHFSSANGCRGPSTFRSGRS